MPAWSFPGAIERALPVVSAGTELARELAHRYRKPLPDRRTSRPGSAASARRYGCASSTSRDPPTASRSRSAARARARPREPTRRAARCRPHSLRLDRRRPRPPSAQNRLAAASAAGAENKFHERPAAHPRRRRQSETPSSEPRGRCAATAADASASLFAAFATVSLSGFGGVLAWSRRMMVEERQLAHGRAVQRNLCVVRIPSGGKYSQFLGDFGRALSRRVGQHCRGGRTRWHRRCSWSWVSPARLRPLRRGGGAPPYAHRRGRQPPPA